MNVIAEGREVTAADASGRLQRTRYHTPEIAQKSAEAIRLRGSLEPGLTFAQFVRLWQHYYAEYRLSRPSLDCYESIINNHLLPYFGPTALAAVDEAMVIAFIEHEYAKTGLGRSVTSSLVKLQAILGVAVKWGYLRVNPVRQVDALFLGIAPRLITPR